MNAVADLLSNRADDLFSSDQSPSRDTPFPTPSPTNHQPTHTADPAYLPDPAEPAPVAPASSHSVNTDQLKTMLHGMRDQIDAMLRLLQGGSVSIPNSGPHANLLETGERVIEGVFNGEKMIGADGQTYSVPPNYASKSKLVEGDMMKLTITNQGRFIYKQIAPIERKRLVGELVYDDATGYWSTLAEGKLYRVLTASVTFYKGKSGDEVVFLVPDSGESSWGAVENIINR